MHPFALLFLLFISIPLLEIYLLIKVGGIIGAMPTVLLVIVTAVVGAWLLRLQGFATLQRVRQTLESGGLPALELLEGVILLFAGALLLTPGFFTDAVGFLCLIPELRRQLVLWASKKWLVSVAGQPFQDSRNGPAKKNQVIEGEFRREDDK